jgi:excisionase family DNA binding protein
MENSIIIEGLNIEQLKQIIAIVVRDELEKFSEMEKINDENKLLSIKEISIYSGISTQSIRNYIKDGKIEAHKIGRRILIDKNQFKEGLVNVKDLKYLRKN